MPDKNMLVFQIMEVQSIANKIIGLLKNSSSINENEIDNLFNRLNELAKDEDLPDDVKFCDLSNCYVEFLKCISIYLVNVHFNVGDFVKLYKWIQIIYDKPSGTQLAQIFTEDIAIPISEEVSNNYFQLGIECSINLLYFVNSVAEKDMLTRHLIRNKLWRLQNLYNAICFCGDYVLQSSFLKFMINICSTTEKYQYACEMFNENPYLEKAFVRTNVFDFEDRARYFLTIVNQTFRRVCSVRAKYLKIDEDEFYLLYDDEDYYSVWLDVNMISQTISISCNIRHIPEHLVSKGNGKVGNEFIIFDFGQLTQTSYLKLRCQGIEYTCFYVDFGLLTEDHNFVKKSICLKIINLNDMIKVEEEIYPRLKEGIVLTMAQHHT